MKKRTKKRRNLTVSGQILTVELSNKVLNNNRHAVFVFNFIRKSSAELKNIRVYVSTALREQCQKDLQDGDYITVSIRDFANAKNDEYELISYSNIKRKELAKQKVNKVLKIERTTEISFINNVNYSLGKLEAIEKANEKRKTLLAKAATKKPEQKNLCRFVRFKDIKHPYVNGCYSHHPIFTERLGLQIEHKFYYIKSKKVVAAMINKRGAKILDVYHDIPRWAGDELVKMYNDFLLKIEK